MDSNEYLQSILEQQTFESSDQELKDLRQRRQEIEAFLRRKFADTAISIRWGGSMAKETMIRQSYDGDLTCYFNSGDTSVGSTLEEIYDAVASALAEEYIIDRKTSALRVRGKSGTTKGMDFHVDVVPGRFTDDSKSDVFIHQNGGTKERLKTNLQTHIDHIKDSGVIDAIRLIKLWNVRNGIQAKTFVLELLTIKLLKSKKTKSLADQLIHVWTEFRDHPDDLAVEDPANPFGNDLKPAIDTCRYALSSVARTTLADIESKGWETVFGPVEKPADKEAQVAAVRRAVQQVQVPTRPWYSGG